MRPMERLNGRSGPLNEHLDEYKVPVQIDEPMEEPEEAGAGAQNPSPKYGDQLEAEALMEEAQEAWARAKSPSPEYTAPGYRSPGPESGARSLVHKTYYQPRQVDKSSHVTQVPQRRKRSEERIISEAWRGRQEPTRRRSRRPEQNGTESSGNRARWSSQDAVCGCWDCQHRMTSSMEAIEELMETDRRRMRVEATWTPEARSRTSSRARSRAALREPRSPRSRTSSPRGHRKVLPGGRSISIHEWRR